MERSKAIYLIQVCWRELGPHQEGLEVHWNPCWLGSYFSSSFLMTFTPLIHPWISQLSRITGCASTSTPLGAPPLVVWLGLTTSWRRTTERKLRVFWGGCDGMFHMFHQVLGWSSCLRCPTNRHAVVRLGRIVSPDLLWDFAVLTTITLSLRWLRWVPVPMHSPSVVSRNPHDIRATDGYGAINRLYPQVLGLWPNSTSALLSLFALLFNLFECFCN